MTREARDHYSSKILYELTSLINIVGTAKTANHRFFLLFPRDLVCTNYSAFTDPFLGLSFLFSRSCAAVWLRSYEGHPKEPSSLTSHPQVRDREDEDDDN